MVGGGVVEEELSERTRGVEAVREMLKVEREGREEIEIVWEKQRNAQQDKRRKR